MRIMQPRNADVVMSGHTARGKRTESTSAALGYVTEDAIREHVPSLAAAAAVRLDNRYCKVIRCDQLNMS